MAKNLFGSGRDHFGYIGKEEHNVNILYFYQQYVLHLVKKKLSFQNQLEFDDEYYPVTEEINVIDGLRPNPGGPFSALTPSMWPQEILAKLKEPSTEEPTNFQPDYLFDEFGFRVEEEDGPEQMSKKILGESLIFLVLLGSSLISNLINLQLARFLKFITKILTGFLYIHLYGYISSNCPVVSYLSPVADSKLCRAFWLEVDLVFWLPLDY